jgi:hypothetical protein
MGLGFCGQFGIPENGNCLEVRRKKRTSPRWDSRREFKIENLECRIAAVEDRPAGFRIGRNWWGKPHPTIAGFLLSQE